MSPLPRLGARSRLILSAFAGALLLVWVVTNLWALPLAAAIAATTTGALWWPQRRRWLAPASALCGVVSLAASASIWFTDTMMMPAEGMLESFLLCALICAVTRWGTTGDIVSSTPVAGVAVAVSISRVDVDNGVLTAAETVAAMGFWALGPLAAVACGLYLRYLEVKREKSIEIAKQAQRLNLAHDLHDYVAHDVSAMIAQAQTAQVFADDATQVRAHLQRIEAAGLAAMSSMDRTVRVLRTGESSQGDVPGLSHVSEMVDRFTSSTDACVTLTIDPTVADAVPRDLESTAYRIIMESLTNVHRHAALSPAITIEIAMTDSHLEVTVSNTVSGHTGTGSARRSGLGLSGLRERVEALGGTFSAGIQGQRWNVHARIPAVADKGAH